MHIVPNCCENQKLESPFGVEGMLSLAGSASTYQ